MVQGDISILLSTAVDFKYLLVKSFPSLLGLARYHFFVFFFSPNLFLYLCFHPDISKNIPKLVLFMLYQGVWGLQHTVKSAFQPLVFIHVIDIRCYETNVADCYAYCSNQLSCLWKSREKKKNYIVTGYKIWDNSRTQRFPWVPNNQA